MLYLASNQAVPMYRLALSNLFSQSQVVLVLLQMTDHSGAVISRNVYQLAGEESEYRKLTSMQPAQLAMTTQAQEVDGGGPAVEVVLVNTGTVPALATKRTLQDAATHKRILPAFYSNNYVSLLPGEILHLTIRYSAAPAGTAHRVPEPGPRGWNFACLTVRVAGTR